MVVRTIVVALASLGALLLPGLLFVIVVYNPSKLPLELLGIRDYTILDSDESNRPLRSASLYVATKRCDVDELRTVAREIKQEYRGYDYVDILFTRRFAESPCEAVAVIGLTEMGRKRIGDVEDEPLSGSKNGDDVYFFRLTRAQVASHDLDIVPGHGFALVPYPREVPARPFACRRGDPSDVFVVRLFPPGEQGHSAVPSRGLDAIVLPSSCT